MLLDIDPDKILFMCISNLLNTICKKDQLSLQCCTCYKLGTTYVWFCF